MSSSFNIDELLLEQLRKAKDIAIEQRRITTTLPMQSLFFSATEAQDLGLPLQKGWMLKITPIEGGEGYTSSLITPGEWEITEDDLYISPEGKEFTRADMEALLSMPTGGLTAKHRGLQGNGVLPASS